MSLFLKKPLETVRAEAAATKMHRALGPLQLVLVGIGCIVGAGVYVMTGAAAANFAGPAVVVSFVLAALACGLIGLCYAELASVLPVSGASYTYAYASIGEGFAWTIGWMLLFEFGIAGAALAAGFSGYLVSLLADFGVHAPAAMSTPYVQAEAGGRLEVTGSLNLIAFLGLMAVALVLSRGIAQSSAVNVLLVIVKVGVLIGFVLVGAEHVDPTNWTPFLPPNEGGFQYGVEGVIRAASILFFAYLGFEAVSTAASESKNPARDVPIGILGALTMATLLYVSVALVMTGLVPYTSLNVADPIAVAVSAIGEPVWSVIIKAGAVTGLASVLLVNTYAQSRVAYAMASDGLLPKLFANLHEKARAPVIGTFVFALISGIAAALLPIGLLADLVSLGTALVFSVVALSVIWLRNTHPELPRPFKVPLGGVRIAGVWIGVTPALALVACACMSGPVLIDILGQLGRGDWAPAAIVGGYLVAGALIYAVYGRRNSKLRQATERGA
ncbi:MAG TPA: amino acid permease [Verrucomicrobiae bacterium]|nr:amino acid permease [Verrucomicrobiae bacterium]